MRELREIRQGAAPRIDQMLALQIAARALPGHRRDALGTVLRQDRAGTWLGLADMLGAEAAGDDAHAIAMEIQRTGQTNRVGGHRVRMAVVDHHAGRANAHREAQREIRGWHFQRPHGISLREPLAQLPLEVLAIEKLRATPS